MTSPDEEVRKKSAEAKAKEPEKPSASPGDPLSFVGQLLGDAKNLAVDAVSGTHSGDKVLSAITPQLAAQYQRGKEVQERIASGAIKQNQLSESDRKSLEAFNNVRKNIAQVPLYDRESLTRYVEKGIQQKAKAAPPEPSRPAAKDAPVSKTPVRQPDQAIPKEAGDPRKSTLHPAPPTRKDAVVTTAGDSRSAVQRPSPALRPQDRIEGRPNESRIAISRPQSDRVGASFIRDVRGDSPRNPVLPGIKDLKPQEVKTLPLSEAAKARITELRNSDLRLQTDRPHIELKGDRLQLVQPGAHSQNPERLRPGETTIRPTSQPSHDAAPQPFKVSKTEVFVNKTFAEGSSAISTFERRTGYEARVHQEAKQNLYSRNIESEKQTRAVGRADVQEPKPKVSGESAPRYFTQRDGVAASSIHVQRSFENMRRVLDERISIANNQVQKPKIAEQAQIKSSGNIETRDIPRHLPGSERRVPLSEIRNNLSDHRVQQIVGISEERFPAGLRWQNTIRQPDAAPPAGKNRAPETPGANVSVKSGDRGAAISSTRTGMPGEISQTKVGQNSSDAAKVLSFNGRVSDRYITGAEIALAAIIAAAGAKRIRLDETRPGSDLGSPIPRVQKIQAYLPQTAAAEKGTSRADVPKFEPRRPDVPLTEDKFVSSPRQKGLPQETFTSTFKPTEKRFLTGVEVALAAIIASCGTARIRQNLSAVSTEDRLGSVQKQESNEQEMNEQESSDKPSKEQESKVEARKQKDSREQDFSDDDVPGSLRYLQTHKYNRQTIMIGPGDTFVSIAEKLTHKDGNLGWLIADINLPRIKETYVDGKRIVEVRSRQSIELPAAADIIAFERHRKEVYKAENLITIVVETQIDRELLDEHLGVFVDAAGKSIGGRASGAVSSVYMRTTIGADGSGILPSIALESTNILKVATERFISLTRAALDEGRKPFSKMRESLQRDKIKRRF